MLCGVWMLCAVLASVNSIYSSVLHRTAFPIVVFNHHTPPTCPLLCVCGWWLTFWVSPRSYDLSHAYVESADIWLIALLLLLFLSLSLLC